MSKNVISVSQIFLNLETTDHTDWSEEKIKKKLNQQKELYLKTFEMNIAKVAK
jgi:hypothetical protein